MCWSRNIERGGDEAKGKFAEQPRQGISSMEMEEGAGNKNE